MNTIPKNCCVLAAALATASAFSHTASAAPIDVPNGDFEVEGPNFPDGLADGVDAYMAPQLQSWYQFDVLTNGGPQRYWNPGDPNDPAAIGVARFADAGFGGVAPDGDYVGISITRYNDNKNPDGTNTTVGDYVRDFEAICQVLEDVPFNPNETYTLIVKVGHPPGVPGDPDFGSDTYKYNGYKVQLLAGGEEVNEGSGFAPTVFATNGGTVIAEDNNSVAITVNTFAPITVTYTPGSLTPEQETALTGLPIQIRLSPSRIHSTTRQQASLPSIA